MLQEDGFEPVCMATGTDGQWWFGGVGGVRIVNPANPDGPAHVLLRIESVNALVWTGSEYIAATQGNGLWSLETNGNFTPIQAASRRELLSNIVALHVDTRGYLWCANNYFDGLVRLQLKGGSVVQADHCMHDPFNRESLINNSVLTLCGDAEGNVWAGTLSGMSVFKPLNQQFAVYRHIPGAVNTLSGANTYALFEDSDGSIWSGSLDAGINCIRPDGSVETYTAANTSGLTTPSVRCIFRDRKGRYWVGAGNEGLFRFEPQARRFSKVTTADADGTPLDQLQVKSMTEDE
ncbi:MAG: two-component regulator propeller domain-containing protein, partial [Bacteroidota bacterium]